MCWLPPTGTLRFPNGKLVLLIHDHSEVDCCSFDLHTFASGPESARLRFSFRAVLSRVESSPTTTPGRTAQEDLELVNGKVMYLFVHDRTEADYCLFHSLLSAAGQCCFGSESVSSMLWCRHHDVVNPLLIWIGRIGSDQI